MDDTALYKLFFPEKLSTEDIYELPYYYVHEKLKTHKKAFW